MLQINEIYKFFHKLIENNTVIEVEYFHVFFFILIYVFIPIEMNANLMHLDFWFFISNSKMIYSNTINKDNNDINGEV
jgi:hypothetical protein